MPEQLYDRIGHGYSVGRRTDPRIAAHLEHALGDAGTVLNVGAGPGSYEPAGRRVVAVEPSAVMRAQRPAAAAPVVGAVAEALPFPDDTFDAAMAVLSDHHWRDPLAGYRELRRVARRLVVFQWDATWFDRFWLIRDYLPEALTLRGRQPSLRERVDVVDGRVLPVPVPADCVDGFFHAYWARPHAYLDPAVRRVTSVWARLGPEVEQRAVRVLAADLDSGAWERRNGHLLELDEVDLGARLVVAERR